MQRTVSEEARIFRDVRRSCYAGLDSITLRNEVTRKIEEFIPFDAYNFAVTDPETGLFTHAIAAGVPESLNRAWLQYLYPSKVAAEIIDMAQSGTAVTTTDSDVVRDVLSREGLPHHLRTVLCRRHDPWGFFCLLRGDGSRSFSEREAAFMLRVSPHLTRGLRTAALLDGKQESGGVPPDETADPCPGVILLDEQGRFRTKNGAAARYLDDLADVGRGGDFVPFAVASAVAQLAQRHEIAATDEAATLGADLPVRGDSGRWYTIRASLTEPDATGTTETIVLIEPSQPVDRARILTRLYGLTPREREVLALAAKGRSNKRISRELGISPYTVQEHLGNACDRVGVRTRKALLAKLFFEGYAPRMAN